MKIQDRPVHVREVMEVHDAADATGATVAEVSKKWFRVRDSYGVEVAPGQNAAPILAMAVCIDQMAAG